MLTAETFFFPALNITYVLMQDSLCFAFFFLCLLRMFSFQKEDRIFPCICEALLPESV